jgi:hypothetical protein
MARTVEEILEGRPLTRETITREVWEAATGTPEEFSAAMRAFEKNWILAGRARMTQFPGEYVAVVECNVVAHSPHRDAILAELERLDLLGAEGLAIARPGS